MTAEGIIRSCYPYNGERQDMQIWGILRDEWIAEREASGRA
jgi:RimJ/RimL family protein N-acetyltransferase